MTFKNKIEQRLNELDCEISEVGQNTDWWDDEHWKIVLKYNQEFIFYIFFIVEPQFVMPRKKGQEIYEVKATKVFIDNWNDNNTNIATIQMGQRKFDKKLDKFINDIIKFKREISADKMR